MSSGLNVARLKGDLLGGLTAGVVALPLALAFGVQSGLGAIAGLYGAVVLGICAAFFGGTQTQVSGPTGPMTVVSAGVIAAAIAVAGSIESGLGIIIASFLLAGALQVVFGMLRLGKYVRYIPYPVLSGFMTGIGAIIIMYQIYPFFGHPSVKPVWKIVANIADPISAANLAAVGIGLLTIVTIYIFPKITKAVPSPLVALVLGTFSAIAFGLDVPVIGDIPTGLPEIKLGTLLTVTSEHYSMIIQFGFMLAALGAIDSLLTSVIADNITKTKHDSDRELIGQGIGNLAAACIGGLPGAGATMRTVVNIRAGGRTRISGIVHGLFLLVVLLGAGKYTAYIPLSVLAGILLTVGVGIIDYKALKHLRRVSRADASILLIVLGITIFGNLVQAVGIGIVLACVFFMKQSGDLAEEGMSINSLDVLNAEDLPWKGEEEARKKYGSKVYIKHLYGAFFFGMIARFKELVAQLKDAEVVIIRMSRIATIDQSGIYALEDAILGLRSRGVIVLLTGIPQQPLDMLRSIKVVPDLIEESMIFDRFEDCADWLSAHLRRRESRQNAGTLDSRLRENDSIRRKSSS